MILMISSQGMTLDSLPSPRFGRTPYFIRYNLETKTWQAYPNEAANQSGGAGVAAAQFLIDHGAGSAISSRFGPNAHQALKAAGLAMYALQPGVSTIAGVIEAFEREQLEEIK
jgi:predicted Fe-Mo cluster-binding NifX family protein